MGAHTVGDPSEMFGDFSRENVGKVCEKCRRFVLRNSQGRVGTRVRNSREDSQDYPGLPLDRPGLRITNTILTRVYWPFSFLARKFLTKCQRKVSVKFFPEVL